MRSETRTSEIRFVTSDKNYFIWWAKQNRVILIKNFSSYGKVIEYPTQSKSYYLRYFRPYRTKSKLCLFFVSFFFCYFVSSKRKSQVSCGQNVISALRPVHTERPCYWIPLCWQAEWVCNLFCPSQCPLKRSTVPLRESCGENRGFCIQPTCKIQIVIILKNIILYLSDCENPERYVKGATIQCSWSPTKLCKLAWS